MVHPAMKLEYLPDGSPDCTLIRLYDFTPVEAQSLHAVLMELAAGSPRRAELHECPWVESVGGCRLTLYVSSWDTAINCKSGPAVIECGFTASTWDNVAG